MMVWECSERVIKIPAGVIPASMASYQKFNFFGEMSTFNKPKFKSVVASTWRWWIPVRTVVEGAKTVGKRATEIGIHLGKSGYGSE